MSNFDNINRQIPTLGVPTGLDAATQANFKALIAYFANNTALLGFQFRTYTFTKTGTFQIPHNLGYAPKDLLVTSLTGTGSVQWNYSLFDKTNLSVTISNVTTTTSSITPTTQVFLASGTYTPSATNPPTYIRVKMVGGGGGGAGVQGGAATNGSATTFNGYSAGGGFGAGSWADYGGGGNNTLGSGAVVLQNLTGFSGSYPTFPNGTGTVATSGNGGSTVFGSGGIGGWVSRGSTAPPANTGGGGAGGSVSAAGTNGASGGGSGGYLDLILPNPTGSYAIVVGSGGAGSAGSGGSAGTSGATGRVIIEEYYGSTTSIPTPVSTTNPLVVRLYVGTHFEGVKQ